MLALTDLSMCQLCPDDKTPLYDACKMLDFELEMVLQQPSP